MSKNSGNNSSSSSGMGFCSVLGLIFIVLKLVGVIDWPWVWVLAPFWIGIIIAILVVILAAVVISNLDN